MKTLFCGCDILTQADSTWQTLSNAYLGVDGKTICYIGTQRPQEAYDTIKDMRGKLLIPGLYNCHCHSPMVALRGIGSDLPLQQWLFDKIVPIEERWTKPQVRAASELAIMEMLASGTVSFSDMYMEPDQTAEAVLASGMKANLCRPVQCFDETESYEQNFRARESIELFQRYDGAGDGRLRIDFCIHAEYTCTDRVVRAYSDDCRRLGGRMHMHLSETRQEQEECKARHGGKTPTEYFQSLGVFENPTLAAHCVWVTERDMEILLSCGVSPVHNPTSNMKLGSGFAPIPRMLELGLPVAIGTDGAASNNNLNLMEELHLAAVLHNGYHHDATLVKPTELLRMATVNGAWAQGRSGCGTLSVGSSADIVAIDLTKPHMRPCFEALTALAYQAQASDVVMTMVDGKILYENGVYLTLDSEKVYYEYAQALKTLYEN